MTSILLSEDYAGSIVNGFRVPPIPKVRLAHAVVSVLRLIRNKEDTRQVFETVKAVAGANGRNLFDRFTGTAYGRRVVTEPVRLEILLSDRAWLRSLPDGSFGRAYLDFMEGENLTPEGILASAEEAGIDYKGETEFPEFQRMFLHISVCHDLWHVLTGYGRDPLGELCNLAFSHRQTRNPGFRIIIALALMAQKIERPSSPLMKAVAEGDRMGRGVDFLLQHDVAELLPLQLAEVRRQLNFIEPAVYKSVPAHVRNSLLKPRVQQTQAQREAHAA